LVSWVMLAGTTEAYCFSLGVGIGTGRLSGGPPWEVVVMDAIVVYFRSLSETKLKIVTDEKERLELN
jgi:hypothetical protein